MAADATVKVSADTSKFTTGMKKADKSMDAFTREAKKSDKVVKQYNQTLKKTGKTAGGIGKSLGGLAIAGAALAGFKSYADEMDRIGKLAKRLDSTPETIQRIAFAAELAGATLEQVANAMTRLVRKSSDFGNVGMAQAFKDLNVDQKAFVDLDLEGQLVAIAKGFNDAGGDGKAFAALFKILEDDAKQLLPLFREGEDGIRAMFESASVASNETVASMEKINDLFTVMKQNGAAAISFLIDKYSTLFEKISDVVALGGSGQSIKEKEKQQSRLNAVASLKERGNLPREFQDADSKTSLTGELINLVAGKKFDGSNFFNQLQDSIFGETEQQQSADALISEELLIQAEHRADEEERIAQAKRDQAKENQRIIDEGIEIAKAEKEAAEAAKTAARDKEIADERAARDAAAAQKEKDASAAKAIKDAEELAKRTAQGNLSAAESALSDTQSGSGQDYISNALRSIGGGFGNAQISGATKAETAIQKQITLQQQQVEELKKVVSALNDETLTTGVAAAS